MDKKTYFLKIPSMGFEVPIVRQGDQVKIILVEGESPEFVGFVKTYGKAILAFVRENPEAFVMSEGHLK